MSDLGFAGTVFSVWGLFSGLNCGLGFSLPLSLVFLGGAGLVGLLVVVVAVVCSLGIGFNLLCCGFFLSILSSLLVCFGTSLYLGLAGFGNFLSGKRWNESVTSLKHRSKMVDVYKLRFEFFRHRSSIDGDQSRQQLNARAQYAAGQNTVF